MDNSTGGVRYFDGLTSDARLVMDTLASASQSGAKLYNYTRFIGAKKTTEGWLCDLEDGISGERRTVHCRGIINASGVWSPSLSHSKVQLRPTKGVHLVIDRKRLEVPSAVVLTDESRILFLIPWGDRTIVGTTDTDYSGSLDDPVCDDEDLAYVLANVNAYFPSVKLHPSDVLSTWAGLRPLVADPNGNPSDISRKHEISMAESGWWDVTGGKLTTYRLIAEQAVDALVHHLNLSASDCATASTPLIKNAPQEVVYSGCRPPKVSREVVEYYVAHEWVVHLDDLMVRRTSWCHYLEDPFGTAQRVAGWMAELLEWSPEREEEELDRYKVIHEQLRACLPSREKPVVTSAA
jgi:glycerol-3-phosphate dehydrogenase